MNKKKLLLLLLLLASATLALFGCKSDAPELTALADWQNYTIVRPDVGNDASVQAAIDLRSAIEDATGVKIAFVTDWVNRGEEVPIGTAEILIGETNRAESAGDVLLQDWEIEFVGNRVAIRAGSDEKLTEAITWFIANCVDASGIRVPLGKYGSYGNYPLKDVTIGGIKLSDYSFDGDSELQSLSAFIVENTGAYPSGDGKNLIRYVQSDELGTFEMRVALNDGNIELTTNANTPEKAVEFFMNLLENRASDALSTLDSRKQMEFSTRTELAQGVYAAYHLTEFSPGELAELTERVHASLDLLNSIDNFDDLDYKAEYGRELWFAAALGFFTEFSGANIEPERAPATDRAPLLASDKSLDRTKLTEIFEGADSKLARASALFLYKKAREVVFDDSLPKADRDALYALLETVKSENRDYGEATTVTGSPEDEIGYIYSYENGPFVRNVTVDSGKGDGYPVEIVMLSDTHYNLVNKDDLEEANPSVMSSYEGRTWLSGGASVNAVRKALDYADYSDLTVVAGDILDFLSLGAQQLAVDEIFRRDLDMLACPGGHDVTRVMQGQVADPTSKESREEILGTFWSNNLHYASVILGDKVMAISLDNDAGYKADELAPLKADLEKAREEGLVVLIFQHEQLCTGDPADTNVPYIRAGDTGDGFNFSPSGNFIGANGTGGVSREIYELICASGDVIKGIFCGHWHNDMYTEIHTPDGGVIPQYVSTAAPYDGAGHVIQITVK